MTIDDAKNLAIGDLVCRGNDGVAGYIVVRTPYRCGNLIVVDLADRFRPDAPIMRTVPIEDLS
jgi:hypothetical protein